MQIVCSNIEWRDGTLITEYRKPFDILTDYNPLEKGKRVASDSEDNPLSGWYALGDSNPCRRRERAVS